MKILRNKLQTSQRKRKANAGIKIAHILKSKYEVQSLTSFPLA